MADKGGDGNGGTSCQMARLQRCVAGPPGRRSRPALDAPGRGPADPGLPAALVSSSFPGLVVAPPGAGNGPLTGGDLDLLGVNPSSASTTQNDLDSGVFSGYFRTWSRQPDNGATSSPSGPSSSRARWPPTPSWPAPTMQ